MFDGRGTNVHDKENLGWPSVVDDRLEARFKAEF